MNGSWSASSAPGRGRRHKRLVARQQSRAIVKRTMQQLNAKGRGIILMHDIHRATAMALPILLKELKTGRYNVVHVMAAGRRQNLSLN